MTVNVLLNSKQEELIQELFEYAKAKFPEIEIVNITAHPENPNHIWVEISGIDFYDDDKYFEFSEYVSPKEEDILVDYGYPINLMVVADEKSKISEMR